jgi:soluble lytic murein transglycosylase
MGVFIFRLISTALVFAVCASVAIANPNLNFAAIAMADDVPFKLNYSPLDFEFGKNLNALYGELQKNELTYPTLQKISHLNSKPHSYNYLNPFVERLERVYTIKNIEEFYRHCEIKSKNVDEYTESLLERFDITLDKFCRARFFGFMRKLSPNMNLSSRDLSFLKAAAPFIVDGENQTEVSAFLKHFKPNKLEHDKISEIIINQYIEQKTKPTSAILQNLYVSTLLTQFLQNNLHLDKSAGTFFQEEFQKSIKDAQELVEKGDFTTAKNQVMASLSFYQKNKKFISENRAWVSTTLAAKSFFYKGRDADAQDIFLQARAIAPKDEFSESHFYLIWIHLINKNYKEMKSVVEKFQFEKNFEQFDSKVQFWIAYSFLKTGDTKKANQYFNKIISNSPYSFYSIISLKELASQQKNVSEQEFINKIISKEPPVDYKMDVTTDELKNALRRLAVWNSLGNERFATLELRHIQTMKKEDVIKDAQLLKKITSLEFKEFIVLNLVRLLHSQEKFITSFKIFQESLGENSLSLNYRLIKYIFPLSYLSVIEKNANSLDPLIIISLIRQESAFNPFATSRVGAKGLMQLMPATAKRMNRKVKVKQLSNPDINVSLGTKYLKQLLNRFDGNLIYTLASYNAGENRIDRWKKEIFRNDDPLATIEAIPFEETRNYVKLIYRNKFFYSLLSNRSVLNVPLEDTFKITVSDLK